VSTSTLLSRSLSVDVLSTSMPSELVLSSGGHDGRVAKLLEASKVAKLRSQELTYDEVDRPVAVPPVGYAHFSRTHQIAASTDFGVAGRALMTWQVQARSGLRIFASSLEVEPGAVVIMRLGVGVVALSIPCRVVDVIDEPDSQGFSYGSLPGHPESGEESFLLQRTPGGVTTFTVSAFSRPASRLAKLGGPLTTAVQRFMTDRYLHALG
jgi:uncharacterized protein (UPF0548 family)